MVEALFGRLFDKGHNEPREQIADPSAIALLVMLATLRDAMPVDRNAGVLITVFAASGKTLEKQE